MQDLIESSLSSSITLTGIFERFIYCEAASYLKIHIKMRDASFWFMVNHSQLNV